MHDIKQFLQNNSTLFRITAVFLFSALAVTSQLWQPFVLGFFHDDWYLFALPRLFHDKFHYIGTMHIDRPGYSILSKLIIEFWDGQAVTFNLIKNVIVISTWLFIVFLIVQLQVLFECAEIVLAAACATYWIVAPWGLGYTLWGTGAFTNTALLFFCISMIYFIRWSITKKYASLMLTLLFFTASAFTYQSCWFGFMPFFVIIFLRNWQTKKPIGRVMLAFGGLLIVQLGSMFLSYWASGKQTNESSWALLRTNLLESMNVGAEFFGPTWSIVLKGAVLLGAIVAILSLLFSSPTGRLRGIGGVTLVMLGTVITCGIYTLAGYYVVTGGVMSRTLQVIDFWAAVGSGLLFSPSKDGRARAVAAVSGYGVVTFVIILCAGFYLTAARPWIRSWRLQGEILKTSGTLADVLQAGDVVETQIPMYVKSAPVFAAPWDITSAVLVVNQQKLPELSHDWPKVQIIPPYPWLMSWKPGAATIGAGWVWPAKRLLVWDWKTGLVEEIDSPVDDIKSLFSDGDVKLCVDLEITQCKVLMAAN